MVDKFGTPENKVKPSICNQATRSLLIWSGLLATLIMTCFLTKSLASRWTGIMDFMTYCSNETSYILHFLFVSNMCSRILHYCTNRHHKLKKKTIESLVVISYWCFVYLKWGQMSSPAAVFPVVIVIDNNDFAYASPSWERPYHKKLGMAFPCYIYFHQLWGELCQYSKCKQFVSVKNLSHQNCLCLCMHSQGQWNPWSNYPAIVSIFYVVHRIHIL